jgi:hypothetical protein
MQHMLHMGNTIDIVHKYKEQLLHHKDNYNIFASMMPYSVVMKGVEDQEVQE